MELHMNPFKGRHFQRDIILWAVRWYCKYGISYRELQEMLAERGSEMITLPIWSSVFSVAPEMEKRALVPGVTLSDLARGTWMKTLRRSMGRWAYSYRAVDSRGRTVDFISPPVS